MCAKSGARFEIGTKKVSFKLESRIIIRVTDHRIWGTELDPLLKTTSPFFS